MASESLQKQKERYGPQPQGGDNPPIYSKAGLSLLAAQPAEYIAPETKAESAKKLQEWVIVRSKLNQRIDAMRLWRNSWWRHWSLLAQFILPRRYTFWQGNVATSNVMSRGDPVNQSILDPTGTQAMRICAAGMFNGLSSPSRPWFKFKMGLPGTPMDDAAKEYFDVVEERIYAILSGSNFYDSLSQQTVDLVTFGTAPLIIYEDDKDIIRCYTPAAGEYFVAASSAFRAETLARQFVMTVIQIVEMFTIFRCPPSIQGMWKSKGANLETEFIVSHIIEPNYPLQNDNGDEINLVDAQYPWREVYWIYTEQGSQPLSSCGYYDQPHMVPRWATMGNDAYGMSPGMDTLPDIMQLQLETARKAEAIEKLARPPIVADMQLKNQPSSTLPGGVTFVANLNASSGMRPVYQVEPRIQEMMEDLKEIQQRIKSGFFNDIFMAISNASLRGGDETAYEIAKVYEEKLQVLGPIIERQQNENHGPALKRVFKIMERKGLLPPLPKSLHNVPIGIQYVSIIAIAQQATATAGIERIMQVVGNLQGAYANDLEQPKDNLNPDKLIETYADLSMVKPQIFNSKEEIDQIRQGRAKAAQQAQQAQQLQATVQGAQQLSQTSLEGKNALTLLAGNAGGTGGQ